MKILTFKCWYETMGFRTAREVLAVGYGEAAELYSEWLERQHPEWNVPTNRRICVMCDLNTDDYFVFTVTTGLREESKHKAMVVK